MINLRRSNARGATQLDWLDSRHTFSFGDYYDPEQMGFRSLRVINDDRVSPGQGFGMHGHRDMEIVTYMLGGSLEHRDSLGSGAMLRRGDVQRMSAGTGIRHSEFNPSQTEPVHLLQIWLSPERSGLRPEYEQRRFSDDDKRARLRLLVSHDGRDGSLSIHQATDLFAALLGPGQGVQHQLRRGRHAWVQIAKGMTTLNDHALTSGDGAAISDESVIEITASEETELLLFDLA